LTEKALFDKRLKGLIRLCAFGKFSPDYALKYINSGILGFETNKEGDLKLDKEKKPIPITISRRTYFRVKAETLSEGDANKEFSEFVSKGYLVEMQTILSVLAELHAQSLDNLARAKNPKDKQMIINSIFRNLPAYTQYMDILKKILKTGVKPTNETLDKTNALATHN